MLRALIFLFSVVSHADPSLMILRPGEMRRLGVHSPEPIRVSSSQVVRVIDQGAKILIIGRKVGRAVISHGQGAYRVEVVSPEVQRTYMAFDQGLRSLKGLHLDVEQDRVFVRGTLLRWKDWALLKNLFNETGGAWRMRARIDPLIQSRVRREISLLSANAKLPAKTVEFLPYPIATVSTQTAKRIGFKKLTDEYGIESQIDESRLTSAATIRLRLTFAEVQSDAGQKLGLKYEDGQSVQLLPQFKGPEQLSAALMYLAAKGEAKILATPSLSARSESEAEFLAGGEFAVRTSTHRVKEVTWKRHGLWLKFKPKADENHFIRLDIQTEFSLPDFAGAVDGIPALRTNKTSSSVDVQAGRSLLLSGLVRTWDSEAWTGIAGLAQMPVLGRLFRSQDFAKNRTELMIFISPEIVGHDPAPETREDTWE